MRAVQLPTASNKFVAESYVFQQKNANPPSTRGRSEWVWMLSKGSPSHPSSWHPNRYLRLRLVMNTEDVEAWDSNHRSFTIQSFVLTLQSLRGALSGEDLFRGNLQPFSVGCCPTCKIVSKLCRCALATCVALQANVNVSAGGQSSLSFCSMPCFLDKMMAKCENWHVVQRNLQGLPESHKFIEVVARSSRKNTSFQLQKLSQNIFLKQIYLW